MDWYSETAIVWLPSGQQPYPPDFATRAAPGTSDFYYLALDALDVVFKQWPIRQGSAPWAFNLREQRLYSPEALEALRSEWQQEFDGALSPEATLTACPSGADLALPPPQRVVLDHHS